MMTEATLTPREREIAELIAWGGTKKEIADQLYISERTVENHARNIYEKTGVRKSSELSAWWFCYRFRIPMSLSPFARKAIGCAILAIYIFGMSYGTPAHPRARGQQTCIAVRPARIRRNEKYYKINFAA
jgi:DNA-binding CsgD family transcriptional regulator